MVLSNSLNRRHSAVQKRAPFRDVRDLQHGPKLALRAVNDSLAAPAASSSSSSPSPIAIATSTSTHAPTLSTPSPFVASSSSANRVASVTPTTSSATTSIVTSTTRPAAATPTSPTSTSTSASISSSSSHVSNTSTVPSAGTTLIAGPFTVPTAVTTYIPPTFITTTTFVSTASPSTTTASKNLLANTGAAAAVFTAVGLVGLALVIMIVSFLIKKRRRAQSQDDEDEYFEKIVTSNSYDNSGVVGSRGLASLDPVHFSDPNARANNMYNTYGGDNYDYTAQDSGLEYPPGTSYTPQEYANAYNIPGTRNPGSRATLNSMDDPFGSRIPERVAPAHVSNPRGHPHESSDWY